MAVGERVKLSVRVAGYPPKKDGPAFMWTKRHEASRARTLREAFADEMGAQPAFAEPVLLEVEVFVPVTEPVDAGDLDHYVAGICDALEVAPPRTPWRACPDWAGVTPAAAPDRALVLADDGWVTEIRAAKSTDADAPYYTVTVAPLPVHPV